MAGADGLVAGVGVGSCCGVVGGVGWVGGGGVCWIGLPTVGMLECLLRILRARSLRTWTPVLGHRKWYGL